MKTWYVWGINLPKLEIKANSLDNAIAQARKINKNYNIAQIKYYNNQAVTVVTADKKKF